MESDSKELIRKAIKVIDENLFVTSLAYTVSTGEQKEHIDSDEIKNAMSFNILQISDIGINMQACTKRPKIPALTRFDVL